jgi:hypothetical protein
MYNSLVLSIGLTNRRCPEAERKDAGIFPEVWNREIPKNIFTCK